MQDVFSDLGAEIADTREKVDELTAGTPVTQPVPFTGALKNDIPAAESGGSGQKSEMLDASASLDTASQKKCPMCGCRMDFQLDGEVWMCYSCAYEESGKGEVNKTEQKTDSVSMPSSNYE